MIDLQWKQFVGQERIKEVFGAAITKGTLGHAYLLCGEHGTGTFTAALELSMALLCTHPSARPCYVCDACHKVQTYSHPDFHVIMPVCLGKEHKASDGKLSPDGWNFLSSNMLDRIKDPYRIPAYTGIPQVPVEWVREVNHAIIRGSLEDGKNVAILDGVDMMGKEAANAMLKTLEEPPADTIMLLLTDRIHSVLPTILSRCQILRFGYLSPETIRSEMAKRFSIDLADHRLDSAADSGSLGNAIYMYENPAEDLTVDAAVFWNACTRGEWEGVVAIIDKMAQVDELGTHERFFVQLINLLRGTYLSKLPSAQTKYFTINEALLLNLGIRCSADDLEKMVRVCQESISFVRVRGNIQLILANLAISIMEMFDGKK